MTYPTNLEKVYHVRYSTYDNGNIDFIEDDNGKWEFETLKEANALYNKTVESKEHDWVAITRTLKLSEDEFNELYPDDIYPDLLTIDEYSWDDTDEESDDEEDEAFTEKWIKCATQEERFELLAATFNK